MTWSSVDLAGHCRADIERTAAFEQALKQAISPHDVVLDIGAGSGVLSIISSRCGARRTIAVENDPAACYFLSSGLAKSKCVIEVVCAEASEAILPQANLVVAELLDVWLLEEDFANVIYSLASRGVITAQTKIVPAGYDFDIAFGTANWNDRYPEIPWPHYQWPFYDTENWAKIVFSPFMELRHVHSVFSVNLAKRQSHFLDLHFVPSDAEARKLVASNAIQLSGTVTLWNDVTLRRCGSMNAPLIIPIRSPEVTDCLQGIRISAKLAGGIRSLRIAAGNALVFGSE